MTKFLTPEVRNRYIQLSNIQMFSKQDVFSHVLWHARTQKKKCQDHHGIVQLIEEIHVIDDHDPVRLYSFIGICMSRELFQNINFHHEFRSRKLSCKDMVHFGLLPAYTGPLELLDELEIIHDFIEKDDWEEEFKTTAQQHNLNYYP